MVGRVTRGRAALTAAALMALTGAAACGGGGGESTTSTSRAITGVTALPRTMCGPVEYRGAGQPNVLIPSDLPMHGASRGRSQQMVAAMRLVLDKRGWRAGTHRVAFQVCDDSLAKTGAWDPARCRSNAQAYVGNRDVVGVLGTYNSGCAAEMMPILNRAPGGGVAMVSPGNTLVCLTQPAGTCPRNEPRRFYPSGSRSYVRVVPNDAYQAAGLVLFTRASGWRRAYVLHTVDDPTSIGAAVGFRNAATAQGNPPVGFRSWDPKARDYTALMRAVARARPDVVVLAGLTEHNGGEIIKAKVAALGPNDRVPLVAFDGFAQQSTITEAGAASRGMYVSNPGLAPSALQGPGRDLVEQLKRRYPDVELFAPYAGEAADVLLDAIASGGTSRPEVVRALFRTRVRNGIVGNFEIGPSGDPTYGPITISRASATFQPVRKVEPSPAQADAARR